MMAATRIVTFDSATRRLMVDGSEIIREDVNHSPPNKGGLARGRREKTCGLCGKSGHTRASCGQQGVTQERKTR